MAYKKKPLPVFSDKIEKLKKYLLEIDEKYIIIHDELVKDRYFVTNSKIFIPIKNIENYEDLKSFAKNIHNQFTIPEKKIIFDVNKFEKFYEKRIILK